MDDATGPSPHPGAERLAALGFMLVGRDGRDTDGALLDLDETVFSKAVRAFARRTDSAEMALVSYGAHGMQIDGAPYLLPVDVPRDDLELLRRTSIARASDYQGESD